MRQASHLGYKYGTSTLETEKLKFKFKLLAEEYKKVREELDLYKGRFGQIFP